MLRAFCSASMGCMLFIFSVLQLLCGIAFLVVGLLLENPPKAGVPLVMVIFACAAMVTALFGMISSCCSRFSCVLCYIVWGSIITAIELAIVLACIIDPSGVVDAIIDSCSGYDDCNSVTSEENRDSLYNIVIVGRWVLLGWVVAEVIFMGVAICMCTCCSSRKGKQFRDVEKDPEVDAARARLRAIQMQNVALEAAASERAASKQLGGSKKSRKGSAGVGLAAQDATYSTGGEGLYDLPAVQAGGYAPPAVPGAAMQAPAPPAHGGAPAWGCPSAAGAQSKGAW